MRNKNKEINVNIEWFNGDYIYRVSKRIVKVIKIIDLIDCYNRNRKDMMYKAKNRKNLFINC